MSDARSAIITMIQLDDNGEVFITITVGDQNGINQRVSVPASRTSSEQASALPTWARAVLSDLTEAF